MGLLAHATFSFTGRNGIGAITVTGLKVGDIVEFLTDQNSDFHDVNGLFEAIVSVADQIQQQSASNLTTFTYTAYIARAC